MRFVTIISLFFLLYSRTLAQSWLDNLSISINGTIINKEINPTAKVYSENGKFWCTYEVTAATDEMRELSNFRFYENQNLIFTMHKVPGSDVEISNSGYIIFYDHSEHFNGKLKIHIYSNEGSFLVSEEFMSANLFEFSSSGEKLAVGTPDGISVISLVSGESFKIEKGLEIAIDETGQLIAVAQPGRLLIYQNSELIKNLQTGIEFPRKLMVSSENNFISLIDKFSLRVYSLSDYKILFEENIGGDLSFRDLKLIDDKIITGIHKKNKQESTGLLRVYDLNGNQVNEKSGESRQLRQVERINFEKKSESNYDPIPWPFFPFDSMRTVWNHYEQHMGLGGSDSYLHQGLDIITPIGEPTYSVIDGFVKLVLTTGGSSYWRTAISAEQVPGWSNGWLSAHLIQSTIQVDVGDTIQIHDYLGDIIQWASDWGHIHFVEIRDSGLVWLYTDNEWGINFSPILALQPYPDTTAPYIDPVFPWSKFAFAKNESAVYLQPDSLIGEIDIIVKVVDYVGDSEWQQPAYTTWYTIKKMSNGEIIKPKTLGHILNHTYSFYNSTHYQSYAGVMFQRDNILQPSSWMDTERNYYHNLTNSNGDSLVELSEKSLAFNTTLYPDGDYRIIVEVYDEMGNFDIDSMDVKIKNVPVGAENESDKNYSFILEQNYPNPFNPTTKIKFTIPTVETRHASSLQMVTLKVYDVLGNEIATLVNEDKPAGEYEVEFNGSELTSGIYFYKLTTGEFSQTRKMILIK
jgi:hypothetical protein